MKKELFEAARYGELERVKKLLDAGANVNATNEWGYTALHYAAEYGHKEIVALLKKAGAK